MLETNIYTKTIELGPELGSFLVQVELNKNEDPEIAHVVSTRKDLKTEMDEDRDVIVGSSSVKLDETIRLVVQSKTHLLMEEEREDTLRFLKNRGFNPFYQTTASGIILS